MSLSELWNESVTFSLIQKICIGLFSVGNCRIDLRNQLVSRTEFYKRIRIP